MSDLTVEDIGLLVEALATAASRHESQARALSYGWAQSLHDEQAAAMRKLRARLIVNQGKNE